MIFNEIKCCVNTSLGLVGGMHTLHPHPLCPRLPEVIGRDNNWRRLQILESSLIQEHKPELNANIPSMPLCIFNL